MSENLGEKGRFLVLFCELFMGNCSLNQESRPQKHSVCCLFHIVTGALDTDILILEVTLKHQALHYFPDKLKYSSFSQADG